MENKQTKQTTRKIMENKQMEPIIKKKIDISLALDSQWKRDDIENYTPKTTTKIQEQKHTDTNTK